METNATPFMTLAMGWNLTCGSCQGDVTRGLITLQTATEFAHLLHNGHNQSRVDVCHPTQGSNTHSETDAGKERETRDHRDASRTITG
jgi:hypothetical protein